MGEIWDQTILFTTWAKDQVTGADDAAQVWASQQTDNSKWRGTLALESAKAEQTTRAELKQEVKDLGTAALEAPGKLVKGVLGISLGGLIAIVASILAVGVITYAYVKAKR